MKISKFRGYLFNLILIWGVLALYKNLPYYISFLRSDSIEILTILAYSYTIGGLIFYIFVNEKKINKTKGELIFSLIHKTIINSQLFVTKKYKTHKLKINKKEKVALLFVIVKIFYLPIMLNFVLANYFSIKGQLPGLIFSNSLFTIHSFNILIYPFLLATLFFIDTLWFAFGYATESSILKNKIRSVEPTLFGWVVALIC